MEMASNWPDKVGSVRSQLDVYIPVLRRDVPIFNNELRGFTPLENTAITIARTLYLEFRVSRML